MDFVILLIKSPEDLYLPETKPKTKPGINNKTKIKGTIAFIKGAWNEVRD